MCENKDREVKIHSHTVTHTHTQRKSLSRCVTKEALGGVCVPVRGRAGMLREERDKKGGQCHRVCKSVRGELCSASLCGRLWTINKYNTSYLVYIVHKN